MSASDAEASAATMGPSCPVWGTWPTDDADEQATRLYMVIGRLDRYYPEIRCRFACGGQHVEIPAEQICERTDVPFSTAWLTAVHSAHHKEAA